VTTLASRSLVNAAQEMCTGQYSLQVLDRMAMEFTKRHEKYTQSQFGGSRP
jgi:hypothetical protein